MVVKKEFPGFSEYGYVKDLKADKKEAYNDDILKSAIINKLHI